MPKCQVPTCSKPATETFRETYLCDIHLEMARVWEFMFGGPVRPPTIAELKQARGNKQFAEYALDYFLKMNIKYGAVDFEGGSTAGIFRKWVGRLSLERKLKIWTFQKGAHSWNNNGKATVYLVRGDLQEKTH